jgi:hypothetical protein
VRLQYFYKSVKVISALVAKYFAAITLIIINRTFIFCCGVILFAIKSCSYNKTVIIPKWGIFENDVIAVRAYEDPFRDVELVTELTRPDGTSFTNPGFYSGDSIWQFRVMPDMVGKWQYLAYFSDSSKCITGQFICKASGKAGPLIVNNENPYWLGFKDSRPKQVRSFHVGDRFFASNFDTLSRIKFLDWIAVHGYNMISVASHYLNRQQPGRGNGWDTPKLWPLDPEEFVKLESILYELEKRDIIVYPFAGFFGRAADWPTDTAEQVLYIKYTLARLSSFRNIILNVAGPEPILKPEDYQNGNMKKQDINRLAALIKEYDPYDHLLSVHNRTRNDNKEYERDPFVFEAWEDYSTLQGGKSNDIKDVYEFIASSRKVIKPVFAQEVLWYGNMYHTGLDEETLRKKAITLLMAGSFINFGDMNGNSSSGFSGCLDPDSAHAEAHIIMQKVWDIFDNLPFSELVPRPDLIEGGFCLSDGAGKLLIYSPDGKPFTVNFSFSASGQWINPRDDKSRKFIVKFSGNTIIPPDENDWLFWIDD